MRTGNAAAAASKSGMLRFVEAKYAPGTRMENRSDLGRVVVATRDFNVGDIILREDPIMVWKKGDEKQYIDRFQSLPESDRLDVLDMFYPPLDNPSVSRFSLVAQVLGYGRAGMSQSMIHKLLAISSTNAHEYYGHPESEYHEVVGPTPRAERAALFLYASKVAHSCSPNAAYSSKTTDGKLQYKAICPIQSGDMITFSYLENLLETPMHVRRQQLEDSKAFRCNCARCVDADFCRMFPCPSCDNLIGCTNNEAGDKWICQVCGYNLDTQTFLDREKSLMLKADRDDQMLMRSISSYRSQDVQDMIDQATTSLSRLHFVTFRFMAMYVRLCASHANNLDMQLAMAPPRAQSVIIKQFGSPQQNRKRAGLMGLKLARACECVAAQCTRKVCSEQHPPNYGITQTVFFASQDLMEAGRWEPQAAEHVRAYLPFLRILFGQDDVDVAKIERSLATMQEPSPSIKPQANS